MASHLNCKDALRLPAHCHHTLNGLLVESDHLPSRLYDLLSQSQGLRFGYDRVVLELGG